MKDLERMEGNPAATGARSPRASSPPPEDPVDTAVTKRWSFHLDEREVELRALLMRQIAGALRTCIQEHGPITRDWIGSAAKRAAAQVEALFNDPDWLRSRGFLPSPDKPEGQGSWTEDDLTSPEDAERGTYTAERSRQLREEARRLAVLSQTDPPEAQ